jgi:O-antigen/teichoic acid export membrane protein
LVLQRVTSVAEVGVFSAAFRFPLALSAFPATVALAFYPELFSRMHQSPGAQLELLATEMRLLGLVGIALTVPLTCYPNEFVRLLLGAKWVASVAPVLRIAGWVTALNSLAVPLGDGLATWGLQKRRWPVLVLAIIAGVTSYSLLGGRTGATGGAVAAVIAYSVVLLGYLSVSKRSAQVGFRVVLALGWVSAVTIAPTIILFTGSRLCQELGMVIAPCAVLGLGILANEDLRVLVASLKYLVVPVGKPELAPD